MARKILTLAAALSALLLSAGCASTGSLAIPPPPPVDYGPAPSQP